MNYFLLVASDTDKTRLSMPSAYEVALYRLEKREWCIGPFTRNRKSFSRGDRVLIYTSGKREHGMCFIASVVIDKELYPVRLERRVEIDAPRAAGHVMGTYAIGLHKIDMFQNLVGIADIKHKLSFVKRPESKKWGSYLQGGSVRISEKDYALVTKQARVRTGTQ